MAAFGQAPASATARVIVTVSGGISIDSFLVRNVKYRWVLRRGIDET
jgi:hypothetical protein